MIPLKYYMECKPALNRSNVLVYNEAFEEVGIVTYQQPKDEFHIRFVETETNLTYYAKTNPLKLKPKHIIYNEGKVQIARVRIGVKIIHSIIESDTYLFVKSALFKLAYQVYDNRKVIMTLNVKRIDGKRYYEIESPQKDLLTMFSLFLLAQAVRIKAIIH